MDHILKRHDVQLTEDDDLPYQNLVPPTAEEELKDSVSENISTNHLAPVVLGIEISGHKRKLIKNLKLFEGLWDCLNVHY